MLLKIKKENYVYRKILPLNHIMLKQTDHCVFINLNHGKQNRGKNYLQEI